MTRHLARFLSTSAHALEQAPPSSKLIWDGSRWIRQSKAASLRQQASRSQAQAVQQQQQDELQKLVMQANKKGEFASLKLPNEKKSQEPEVAAKPAEGKRYVRGSSSDSLKVLYTSDIEGVPIPARPTPPASDECCMTGCPRCVYDLYSEDVLFFYEALAKTRKDLRMKGISESRWPDSIRPRDMKESAATTKDPNETTEELAAREVAAEIQALDISLKTFLIFEREMRKKRRAREAKKISLEHVSQIAGLPSDRASV